MDVRFGTFQANSVTDLTRVPSETLRCWYAEKVRQEGWSRDVLAYAPLSVIINFIFDTAS